MRLEVLQGYLKLIKLGSFSEAADELFISQSTLSKQIAELEKSVGQPLLIRSTRSVRTTEAGRLMEKYARRIVEEWQAMEHAFAQLNRQERQTVQIGYTTSEQLSFLLAGLTRSEWTRRELDFSLFRYHPDEILDAVRNGEADCAVMHRPTFLHSPLGLRADCLASSRLQAVLHRKCALASKASLTLADIVSLTDVRCRHSRDPYYYDAIDRAFTEAGYSAPSCIETGESEELEALVLRPNCMSLCPSIYPVWRGCVSLPVEGLNVDFDFLFVRRPRENRADLDCLYEAIHAAMQGLSSTLMK